MFRSILLIILSTFSLFAHATLPKDSIQRCLDVRRLVDISTREKVAAKEPGVLRFKFHKIATSELPTNNPTGDMNEVINALNRQIKNCTQKPRELQTIVIAGKPIHRDEWCLNTNKKMLMLAQQSQGNFQKYLNNIKTEFDWYKSDGWPENHAGYKKGDFQFTAYYAPTAIEARSKRQAPFLYPLYRNPGVISVITESKKLNLHTPLCGVDPISKVMRGYCLKNEDGTYAIAPDRREISQGALDPKYIIGYVKDPNDIAFLMLQGSGSLMLDGKLFHVNYDGANGRPRTMLGRVVQCAQDPTCGGNLDTMERCAKDPHCKDEAKLRCNISQDIKHSGASEKLIRQYLDHPQHRAQADDLRNRDQSYVFFVKEAAGPFGSEGICLTPHASCATDHKVIPIGMNFIYSYNNKTSWCVAQDAGGAIMGAHADCYKGEGIQAGIEANDVNHSGSVFIALPKIK